MTTATFDAALVQTACEQASLEAKKAAQDFYNKHGDRDACGFAWVNVYGVTSSISASGLTLIRCSKVGKTRCLTSSGIT